MKESPNLEYIKALAGGDISFEKKLIEIIKEEFPDQKMEYLENIGKNRTNEAAMNVHKFKNKFNILGLKESYRLAVLYEEDLKHGDTKLDDGFREILDNIENYIKTLKP